MIFDTTIEHRSTVPSPSSTSRSIFLTLRSFSKFVLLSDTSVHCLRRRAAWRQLPQVRLSTFSRLAHLCVEYLSGIVPAFHKIPLRLASSKVSQLRPISPHLFSCLCALEGNRAPFSLSLFHSACVPCDSRSTGATVVLSFPQTHSIVRLWIIWNMTLVLYHIVLHPSLFESLVDSTSALQKGWGIRDWGPHNASVKSCGKNVRWTGGPGRGTDSIVDSRCRGEV